MKNPIFSLNLLNLTNNEAENSFTLITQIPEEFYPLPSNPVNFPRHSDVEYGLTLLYAEIMLLKMNEDIFVNQYPVPNTDGWVVKITHGPILDSEQSSFAYRIECSGKNSDPQKLSIPYGRLSRQIPLSNWLKIKNPSMVSSIILCKMISAQTPLCQNVIENGKFKSSVISTFDIAILCNRN